ncbi:MAG: dienelactone hydrolase family protein [Rickettsiaceae bacterium]|nr:dienelactone hydrolase family protein [Rickettsiaceae bacterium]
MVTNNHPTIPQAATTAKKMLVMLHGVGSDGHDLISLVDYIQPNHPDMYFFSPHGLEKYDQGDYGYQWFSLQDREIAVLQRELMRVAPKTLAMIEKKMNEVELKWGDVVLVGFSQGSMLALYLTLIAPQKFAATIAFSGSLISPSQLPQYINKTPICLVHGEQDNVVAYEAMEQAQKKLSNLGFEVESYPLENLAHSIDKRGIDILNRFLNKQILK